jgi:hypothetical protein
VPVIRTLFFELNSWKHNKYPKCMLRSHKLYRWKTLAQRRCDTLGCLMFFLNSRMPIIIIWF